MESNQTAAGTIFLYSWVTLFIAHLLPGQLRGMAVAIAVILITVALMVAMLIAFDDTQHHHRN